VADSQDTCSPAQFGYLVWAIAIGYLLLLLFWSLSLFSFVIVVDKLLFILIVMLAKNDKFKCITYGTGTRLRPGPNM
jgi:hypothetical protein